MNRHILDGERRLYTAAQVRELDRIAIQDQGIPGFTLMRRAARAAFEALQEHWPGASRVGVFCGGGNNGGDGYLVARLATEAGLDVECIYLSDPEKLSGDARAAFEACREAGVTPLAWESRSNRIENDMDDGVVVDALLGTGLQRPVEGAYAEAITLINSSAAAVMAVDIPSGLSADRGMVMGKAVRADLTCTFIGLKQGLFTGAGPELAGAVRYARLDVPDEVFAGVESNTALLLAGQIPALLPSRLRNAHKGSHGHVLLIGGNHGMGGALRLAGEAALRTGAGLATLATRDEHCVAITQQRPELMCRGVETGDDLAPLIERATVVAVGPGLGTDSWGQGLLQAALATGLPLVVDADALNLIAESQSESGSLPADAVVTPHPGEAARLLGCKAGEVQQDRFDAAARLQERLGCVVVLKGAGTLITDAGQTAICPYGNPGMAVAGMGDLLCGVIAALRAQGLSAGDAARTGVMLHALAGDAAADQGGERGLLPSDLLHWIRRLANGRGD